MHYFFPLIVSLYPTLAFSSTSQSNPTPFVLIGLVILFLSAKVGGFLAEKFNQPPVLGEMLFGILIGNLTLFGFQDLEPLRQSDIFLVFAEIGIVLLLFEVGLESSLKDMLKVGPTALLVAVVGMIFPFLIGLYLSHFFMPEKTWYVHIFMGATLCATSVGITARVLKDLGKIHLKESRIILGAAVIDDVLGLVVLAIITGLISKASDNASGSISVTEILFITGKAILFLVGALYLGTFIAPRLFRYGAQLKTEGILQTLTLSICFFLAYLAHIVGLAPIVGAFAAGLIIDGTGFSKYFGNDEKSLESMLHPVSKFFVPLFFVHMGMQVDLQTFISPSVIFFGIILSTGAVIGKICTGLGVFGKKNQSVSKLIVGLGMIPRGEVGLIFAVVGTTLVLQGEKIIDQALYSSTVMMVLITTIITPPLLKWALGKKHTS